MRISMPAAAHLGRAVLAAGFLLAGTATSAKAQTQVWTTGTGGSWAADGNWNPGPHPNATGASAVFNNGATAQNVAQTANRTVTLDGAQTVGSITFNNDVANAFTQSVTTGTGGPLTFAAAAGPATVNIPAGLGTGNNTISVATVLNATLVAQVDNVNTSSATGAFNFTATVTGNGGFTKQGDGGATLGTGAKTYTGATVFSGGRTRISQAAQPSATSSVTINAGAQIDLISNPGTYTFGSGPLNLNGSGPTSGPFAAFPGAIRPDRPFVGTITNNTVLQSNSLIHIEAVGGTGNTNNPTGSLTLSGVVSGPGRLTFTAPTSDIDQGFLILTNNNTYSGGTLVQGGILQLSGASAHLGTGNVTVSNAGSPDSAARLQILTGVTNAVDDSATLTLAGGTATTGTASGYADLGAGVNEVVGGLVLGGVAQPPGTYGSSASGAANKNDAFFLSTDTGIITVLSPVPEPGSLALAGLAVVGIGARLLRRKMAAV